MLVGSDAQLQAGVHMALQFQLRKGAFMVPVLNSMSDE